MDDLRFYQWALLVLTSLILLVLAPRSNTVRSFFDARNKKNEAPGFWLLTSSLVISWIFAKSVTVAANLGLEHGIVGGVAYSGYYLGFLVAGGIIYRMRTRGGFSSLHHFLRSRFGKGAVLLFSVLIAFRLFNEVWSNTMVIGTYFGDKGSWPYFIAILVFTVLTLAYSLKGGLRSSMMTDVLQIAFFAVLLFLVLGLILPEREGTMGSLLRSGEWSLAGGLDLFLVALIQMFSYPFHDPVMTDRGFISSPRITWKGFAWAAPIGGGFIVLFSLLGVYAQKLGPEGEAAVMVARYWGGAVLLIVNLIMVTSAASTLDSAFFSFSKLSIRDLRIPGLKQDVRSGRLMMVLIAVAGTLPLFMDPKILSATTVSGTMVIGLAPVFLFWWSPAPPSAFFLSVGSGILIGILYVLDAVPEAYHLFDTGYGGLLTVNLLGSLICFALYGGAMIGKKLR